MVVEVAEDDNRRLRLGSCDLCNERPDTPGLFQTLPFGYATRWLHRAEQAVRTMLQANSMLAELFLRSEAQERQMQQLRRRLEEWEVSPLLRRLREEDHRQRARAGR